MTDLIVSTARLRSACDRWRREPALGVDTEFVRERTFFPAPGLVQIAPRDSPAVLVDPLAVEDLEPLRAILADPAVIKVFHSPSEDLEVFFHLFGELPRALFDTQTAAALTGPDPSPGYARLVATAFGVEIPKDHTRSNWLARPLGERQLEYAALDVAYLLPLYDTLLARVRELGREPWLEEELASLTADTSRFLPDPETAYLRLGGARGLSRRELGVLRELAAWREREARRRDLPRGFVLPEPALIDLARHRPRTTDDLREIRSLRHQDARRHGDVVVELIARAEALPEDGLPEPFQRPRSLADHRSLVDELRRRTARRAEELDVAPEVLANRRTVEHLVRRVLDGTEPVLPAALRGWRSDVLGDELVRLCRERGC